MGGIERAESDLGFGRRPRRIEMPDQPGHLVLFGSGETAPSGRKVFDAVFNRISQPARVAILETPAGFEPNTAKVAQRIAKFLEQGLQNYALEITIVPARKRN